LSGITRVSRYQKKHSPTHHPDHPIFIRFFHLPRSIVSSLFKLRAWQSFCTTSLITLLNSCKNYIDLLYTTTHEKSLVHIQTDIHNAYQEILDELVQEDDLHASGLQRQLDVKRVHVEVFLSLRCLVVQCDVQPEDVVTTERQDLDTERIYIIPLHISGQ